ncbi:ABC transporter permease [Nocardia transvalensis]|uniref:ABC transporter permease n=1 Tax=Nocardia transvalensis TaxID=37333 RepID=UPI0018949EA6|nr:ABC transporter permease [Nocardia transvalensis]MBF6332958.1 ABC transporter permease [Nocardia transvalensis]
MTVLRETGLVFWSQLRAQLRNPVWVVIGLSQPVLYLVLFGPLVEAIAPSMGAGTDPWKVLTPALVISIGLFGAGYAGFGMVAELRSGVLERQRVTPASRTALLVGRVLKDMVVLIVQALLLVAVAVLAFSLRPNLIGLVSSVLLISVMAAGLASGSYALALWARSENTLASVMNSLSLPIMLLSGILLPMSLGPQWLRIVSDINPFKHTVDAARALFRGDFGASEVYLGTGLTLAVAVLLIVIGARSFARENA